MWSGLTGMKVTSLRMESITAQGIMEEMAVAQVAMAVALLAIAAFDGRNRIQYEIRSYQDLCSSLPMTPLKPTPLQIHI